MNKGKVSKRINQIIKRGGVFLGAVLMTILFCAAQSAARARISPAAQTLPKAAATGQIEQVFAFNNQMPTGVTVSQNGRIFVNYPRSEDKVDFTVAELKTGAKFRFPTRTADGTDFETIVHDPRVLWADTMPVAAGGYLYFTSNQLHRQAGYNNGRDLRRKPYSLFRVKIDGTPVRLR